MSGDHTAGMTRGAILTPSYMEEIPEADQEESLAAVQHVRAVVTAVYFYDNGTSDDLSLYCDAYGYGSKLPLNPWPLRRILVAHSAASLHEGDIRIPRPARGHIRSSSGGIDRARLDPAYLDGDHIIVGFLDGKKSLPFLASYIAHPSSDQGKASTDEAGKRMRLVAADGYPRLWKHQGAFFGVDKDGNFVLDLQEAHQGFGGDGIAGGGGGGGWNAQGGEVAASNVQVIPEPNPGVAKSGSMTVKLPANANLTFEFASGEKVELVQKDGKLTLSVDAIDLGDLITDSAVLGNKLDSWLQAITGLSVRTAFGPSGPAINPFPAAGLPDSPLSEKVNLK